MAEEVFQFEVASEAATATFGRALARALPAGCVIGLNGPLGAGKTRLVQAIAEGSGIERRGVISPTFVLVQEYHGQRTIYHADAYRLRDDDEFLALGLDEHFDEEVLVIIEWAERVEACLPRRRLDIRIEATGDEGRRFSFRPLGGSCPGLRERLENELA